jgi:hypothetical protein
MRSTPLTSNIKLGGEKMLNLNPLSINDVEETFQNIDIQVVFHQ